MLVEFDRDASQYQTLEADIYLCSGVVSMCPIWDLRQSAAHWQSRAEAVLRTRVRPQTVAAGEVMITFSSLTMLSS